MTSFVSKVPLNLDQPTLRHWCGVHQLLVHEFEQPHLAAMECLSTSTA